MALNQDVIVSSQQLVAETFRSFRQTLLAQYGTAAFEVKDDFSQVTELDLYIERALKETLAKAYPSLGCAGEELGGEDATAGQPYWLIDPIDSTASFIRGLPNCTNMAALIVENQPVASVIYDFVADVLYTARVGEGAYRNGERMAVSSRPVQHCAVYTNALNPTAEQKQALRAQHVAVFRPLGASGHAYILVAEGKLEGYHVARGRARSHDNAPGALLALEAGAVTVTSDDQPWDVHAEKFAVVAPQLAPFWREHMRTAQ